MFHKIDIDTWPRGQMYYYFAKMAPTGYSLTVDVDVTYLYDTVKKEGIKFFPAYIWLVTRNLNKFVEFKCAEKDGVLGYYDELTPLYANFHEDDETCSLMWTEFKGEFREFYDAFLENKEKYGDIHGILSNPGLPPENAYTVSCMPWIPFKSFSVQSYENKPYYFPSVESGKIRDEDGKKIMPLSITCHHATTDGWHVKEFLKNLNYDINRFDEFLNGTYHRIEAR